MRLLIVNAYGAAAGVGGTEKGIGLLVRSVAEHGIEPAILQAFPGEQLGNTPTTVLHSADGRESRLRWFENHVGDVLSLPSSRFDDALDEHAPDLVHTHNLQGIGTGIWEVCRRHGIPTFHTLHDYHLLCPRVTLMRRSGVPCDPHPALCGVRAARLARWAGSVSDVGGVSEYLVRMHDHVFPHARKHVIRNPVQPVPAAEQAPHSPPRRIGYLGNLTREKGVDVLLRAAPALAALGLELRVAGSGVLEPDVRAAGVSFDGVVTGEAKSRFLAACDIGIIPSVWAEPGGPTQTLVEWLAARRPTLVSARGGLGEVVDEFPGAIAVEPTLGGIVSAAEALVEPQRWAQALADVRPIETEGQVERWVDQHLAIYRSLT